MLPLKDDLDRPRARIALALALALLAGGAIRPLVGLLAALVAFVAADAVAHRSRPATAVVVALGGAALTVGVALAAGDSRPPDAWNPLGPLAVAGAAAALAGAYVGIAPTARVMTLSILPGAGGVLAVPVALWTLVGIALIVVAQATNAILPPGTGLTTLATLAALGLALLAGAPIGLLGRREQA